LSFMYGLLWRHMAQTKVLISSFFLAVPIPTVHPPLFDLCIIP